MKIWKKVTASASESQAALVRSSARGEIGKIGLAERKIKQRSRDQYLDRRKQDSAHFARIGQVLGHSRPRNAGRAPNFRALVWF